MCAVTVPWVLRNCCWSISHVSIWERSLLRGWFLKSAFPHCIDKPSEGLSLTETGSKPLGTLSLPSKVKRFSPISATSSVWYLSSTPRREAVCSQAVFKFKVTRSFLNVFTSHSVRPRLSSRLCGRLHFAWKINGQKKKKITASKPHGFNLSLVI